jgi:RNA polymerase sigma-70 factor (ECF subfamily)
LEPNSDLHTRVHRIVEEHYDPLSSYVRFLTGASADGKDIVHEAFLLAHAKLASGREFEGDPGSWLRGTARNLVYAWWRQKRRLPQDLADQLKLLADEAEDGVDAEGREEMKSALRRCLEKLGAEERVLLSKRYEQGLRAVRIADELRLNVATVRVRLHRLRQALRGCIEGQLSRGGEQ